MRGLLLTALSLAVAGGAAVEGPTPPPKPSPRAAAATRPRPSFETLSAKAAEARVAGRLEEAAGHYARALALRPAWAEGRLALATILFDLKRYSEARDHLQRLTAAGEGGAEAWALLGLASSRLGDYDAALAGLSRARTLEIASAEMRSRVEFETALVLNRTGQHDAAFDVLRAYASEGQDSPTVIVAFGLSMLRLRQMPDEVPPDKRPMVLLAGRGGYHMARPRRTAVGRMALEELVSRYPSQPNAHYALGTYIAPDDPDAAAEEFQKELRLDPDHAEALIQLAHLETRRGRAAAALPAAEKAVALVPDVPAGRLVLGRALLDLERTDEAIAQLQKAAQLAPESAEVHFTLSRAYQRAGRTEDASREREEFLRLEKRAPEP